MRKILKTIGTIAAIGTMVIGSYFVGASQAEKIEVIPEGYVNTESQEFYENYIDMREVTDFSANDNGLQLYLEDGSGYYYERQRKI